MSFNKKVSIQLKLDGHSFSRNTLPTEVGADATVEVELLTRKSTLVPAECFEPELAANYLWIAGRGCTADESPVWSRAEDGVIAVMALRRDISEELQDLYGTRIRYTSPLLRVVDSNYQHLYIYNASDLAYFKLYNGELLEFCEVLPTTGKDDILYMVEKIAQEFKLKEFVIQLDGDSCDELQSLLNKYHKVEKCE